MCGGVEEFGMVRGCVNEFQICCILFKFLRKLLSINLGRRCGDFTGRTYTASLCVPLEFVRGYLCGAKINQVRAELNLFQWPSQWQTFDSRSYCSGGSGNKSLGNRLGAISHHILQTVYIVPIMQNHERSFNLNNNCWLLEAFQYNVQKRWKFVKI